MNTTSLQTAAPVSVPPLHQLSAGVAPPPRFTYPFCYEPHPLCVAAAREVQRHIAQSAEWRDDIERGKMFGVLVVETHEGMAFLAAYSGLLAGRNDWPYFVPPVYDAQQPDGHFKREEARISALNAEIRALEESEDSRRLNADIEAARAESRAAVDMARQRMAQAKARRDRRRGTGVPLSDEERAEMTRESQYLKAELARVRRRCAAACSELEERKASLDARLQQLRQRRKAMSDALQQWLFSRYVMLNARGEESDLCQIFRDTRSGVPPAGSGDCCAPKLLQCAYRHGLRPLCMAEFWWGGSESSELRVHGRYYPACRSKCLPILTFMLQGLAVDPDPLAVDTAEPSLRYVYEDEWMAVVDKPPGMLSVPGREASRCSVEQLVRERWGLVGSVSFPVIVHRLDMDTSGLMVVARTEEAYHRLQRQFLNREVSKCYEAVLDGTVSCEPDGCLSLPLAPDEADRPRQRVDMAGGKEARTVYHILFSRHGKTFVRLYPLTGRTHQLRVHCAHRLGLSCAILGDPLYGVRDRRMWLNAVQLTLRHPADGRLMTFHAGSIFDGSEPHGQPDSDN